MDKSKKNILFLAIGIFLILGIISGYYFFSSSKINKVAQINPTEKTSNVNSSQTPAPTKPSLSKFEQFEKALESNNIKFKKIWIHAAMIGAKEGYRYKFTDDTAVELYLFDTNSNSYKKLVTTKKAELDNLNISFDVDFVDDICFLFNGEPQNKDMIVSLIHNLK